MAEFPRVGHRQRVKDEKQSKGRDRESARGRPASTGTPLPGGGRPDRELVEEAIAGSHAAFEALVLRYSERAYRVAYRVLKDADQVTLGTFAVNLDPAESDLSVFDPEELTSAVTRQGTGAESMDGAIALTPEDREKRQGLWWFLLVGAALMLLTETTISNRLSRRSR